MTRMKFGSEARLLGVCSLGESDIGDLPSASDLCHAHANCSGTLTTGNDSGDLNDLVRDRAQANGANLTHAGDLGPRPCARVTGHRRTSVRDATEFTLRDIAGELPGGP